MKAVDQRPARLALELGSLRILQDIDEAGRRADQKQGREELREVCGQAGTDQRDAQRNRARLNESSRAAGQDKSRRSRPHHRADGVGEQRQADLAIGQMQVVFQRRESGDPGCACGAKRKERDGDGDSLAFDQEAGINSKVACSPLVGGSPGLDGLT